MQPADCRHWPLRIGAAPAASILCAVSAAASPITTTRRRPWRWPLPAKSGRRPSLVLAARLRRAAASLLHPSRMLLTGGLLLTAFAALRRARLRTLGALPLEFEDDDPAAVIVMSPGPSGR